MLLVGYFEGLDSERGIEWRCADSLSLREFVLLSTRETVPDHSWMSKTRSRLPLEVHEAVFAWASTRVSALGKRWSCIDDLLREADNADRMLPAGGGRFVKVVFCHTGDG
jgi:hypothetical protein